MKGFKALFFIVAATAVLTGRPAAADVTGDASLPPVSAQISASYNNNVSASSAQIAALRGLKQVDEIYSPSLVLNYFTQTGIESFYLQGQGGYDYYQRNTILNRERIQGSGGTELQFDDCSTTISGNYSRRQSDLQDLDLGPASNTQQSVAGTFAATCNLSATLVPSGSITQSWSTNTAPLLKPADSRILSGQGSFLYIEPVIGQISLISQYVDAIFPQRLVPTTGLPDGYRLLEGGLRLQHQFGNITVFTGSLSQTSLRSDGGLGINFDGLSYDASLSLQPTPRLDAALTFSRKPSPATQFDATYSIAESYGVQGSYKLTSRAKLSFGASRNQITFNGIALVPGVDITHETIWSAFGTLGYDITSRMSLAFAARLDDRHADVSGFSYSKDTFTLTLSQAF